MPMSSHGSLHQFATLWLKTYILARKERELLVACRPPRGLTPPGRHVVADPAVASEFAVLAVASEASESQVRRSRR